MPQPHRSPRSRPARIPTPELVLIPGGDPNALPIKVAPMPDEWSVSWIRRMAERYEVSPNTFFNHLGYRRKIHSVHAIAGRLNINAHDLADHFLLTEQERRQLAAVPPLSSATRTYARYYDASYGTARSARYCPLCLADDTAYWRASWTQPLMLCCPLHHVTLLNTCPGCHQLLMTGRTWATAPTPLWQCTERLPGRPGSGKHRPRCEHDLRTATTTPVNAATADAQNYLLDLADTSNTATRTISGLRATRSQAFAAFVEILDNAMPSGTDILAPATDPAEVADALPIAAAILHATNPAEAATIAHDNAILAPYDDTSPILSRNQIRNRCHSPVLVAIQLTDWSDHLPKPDQLQFRTGHPIPRYPARGSVRLTV